MKKPSILFLFCISITHFGAIFLKDLFFCQAQFLEYRVNAQVLEQLSFAQKQNFVTAETNCSKGYIINISNKIVTITSRY